MNAQTITQYYRKNRKAIVTASSGLLYGAGWSLGHFTSPSIDIILDREAGFTLEELLDEDELLQECKGQQNTKLSDL